MAKTETPVHVTDMSDLASEQARQVALMSSMQSMISRTAQELAAFSDAFLGPGEPMLSFRGHYWPRRTDYPASVNVKILPDRPFELLRNLAAWDPVRYCIEKRKNGIKRQKWAIGPLDPDDDMALTKYADDIVGLTKYWEKPDPQNGQSLDLWISNLLEGSFLWDAATIMRWPTQKWMASHLPRELNSNGRKTVYIPEAPKRSDIALHRVIDGQTITPKIDSLGNIPLPPAPAYQQVIKGIPLTEYTSEQMLYLVRNPRPDSPYGMSEVEWLMIAINIALRRDTSDLLHWTTGNVPYGFGETPEDWTPSQIEEWGKIWDDMLAGDLAERSKIKWGPAGMNFKEFQERNKGNEDYKFYEWSARRACAIFGVAASPYTSQLTRAGAETSEELQAETAEEPLTQWIERIITNEIQVAQGYPELCFRYVTEKKVDEAALAESNKMKIFSGQTSIDDVLIENGQDPIGCPPFIVLPGQSEPYYLRGMNPDYQKKYKKFFDDLDAKEAAAPVAPVPAKPGEPVPNQEKPPKSPVGKPKEEQKALAIIEDLRKWRKVALKCAKEGRKQKDFQSEAIPGNIRKMISVRLQDPPDLAYVNKTFDAAGETLNKRDLADAGGNWKRPWGEWNGLEIYHVDGPYVRAHFFIDFTEGGNPAAYDWMPEGEIWVEQSDNAADDAANLLHECTEYMIMTGVHEPDYDDAHEVAASLEAIVRRAAAGLSLSPTAAETEENQ